MLGFYTENQAADFQTKALNKAIEGNNFNLLGVALEEADDDMLAAIGRRNDIKLTYRAFRKEDEHGSGYFIGTGKLNTKRLIENIENLLRPLYLKATSFDTLFFAIEYEDGEFEVLEDTKQTFELPDDAELIGIYETEELAYEAC